MPDRSLTAEERVPLGLPEGYAIVPKEPTEEMIDAMKWSIMTVSTEQVRKLWAVALETCRQQMGGPNV